MSFALVFALAVAALSTVDAAGLRMVTPARALQNGCEPGTYDSPTTGFF